MLSDFVCRNRADRIPDSLNRWRHRPHEAGPLADARIPLLWRALRVLYCKVTLGLYALLFTGWQVTLLHTLCACSVWLSSTSELYMLQGAALLLFCYLNLAKTCLHQMPHKYRSFGKIQKSANKLEISKCINDGLTTCEKSGAAIYVSAHLICCVMCFSLWSELMLAWG